MFGAHCVELATDRPKKQAAEI